jgi:hypothetical protein
MIYYSPGLRAEFFFSFREARSSTPMMAADRSTRSFRAILFFVVTFGLPGLTAAATLEDSAREFAQKIAASLPARESVFFEIRNISSMRFEDAYRIEQALTAELQNRGFRILSSVATFNVVVTLSENVKDFVWTAEILHGGTSHAVLQVVSHSDAPSRSADAFPLRLASEQFWVGSERPTDAAKMAAPNGDQLVVVLLAETLVIQNGSKSIENRIHIPAKLDAYDQREPWGTLSQNGNSVEIVQARRVCTATLETYALAECRDSDANLGSGGDGPAQTGGQNELVLTKCTKETTFLVTGTGDDTQTDSLQVLGTMKSSIKSNQVNFSGPVVALRGNSSGTPARAIVRNLQTGNYEGYLLSISCAQ